MNESSLQAMEQTTPNATATHASPSVTVTPRADVLETDDDYLFVADMPGVTPENLDVRFENGELTLHGRRVSDHAGQKRALWEYEVTNYSRTVRLTDHIAADRIEANLKNGVLTLRLPKAETVKARRIAVKGS